MAIKDFKFSLKKVSAKDEELLEALYEYLPATGTRDVVIRGIKSAVSRHIGKDVVFSLEAVHRENFSDFSAKLPRGDVVAVFGMEPLNKKALCDIDPIFAAMIVEYMLGGEPSSHMRMDKPSDTELGVIQYLILQVLSNVHKSSGKNPRVYFRFDRFAMDGGGLLDIAKQKDKVAILIFRASIGEYAGFIRLILPDPFMETVFLNAGLPEVLTPEEVGYQFDSMSKFNFVQTSLWAEGGRTVLLPSELSGIEEGDIVVFEKGDLKLSERGPYGRVTLRVGSGGVGGFDAELNAEAKQVHCKITGFHKGE